MSVEFIGFITNNNSSETIVRTGPVIDRPYLETVAKAHEVAGFDRALLAFHSTTPDCLQIGQHVLGITDRLKVLIAQRPGFTAPTLIARQLATVDQLSGGRVALHVITGGNAAELKQDGNTILIRGFDPLIDAIEYGRELMPLTRKLIAERDSSRGVAAE
jgi:alkanesulfonate monooxygenase